MRKKRLTKQKKTSNQSIEIEKCKKENCSDVIIYNSDSELVKEYNQNLRPEPKKISRQEKTEVEIRNHFYRSSINEIQRRLFVEGCSELAAEVLKLLTFQKHKNKELKRHTVKHLIRKVDDMTKRQLIKIRNELTQMSKIQTREKYM